MRRRSFRLATAGLLLGALGLPALLAGCDAAPGQPDPPGIPPTLSAFSVTPDTVRFEDALEGDSARVRLEIAFEASGGATSAAFAVTPQFADACVAGSAPRPPLVEGNAPVDLAVDSAVTFRVEFAVARDDVGLFDVTVAVFDADGRRSNRGVTVVPVVAEPLGPPTLSTVTIPSPVQLPSSTTRQFTVSATVADPDGARDVAGVELDLAGNTFMLLDDGQSGDGAPCDGVYALTLVVGTESGLEGERPVEVRVTDRAGNVASETGQILFLAP